MKINDDDRPTREEAERDEQGRKPYQPTAEELAQWRRTDPWNPENQRSN